MLLVGILWIWGTKPSHRKDDKLTSTKGYSMTGRARKRAFAGSGFTGDDADVLSRGGRQGLEGRGDGRSAGGSGGNRWEYDIP